MRLSVCGHALRPSTVDALGTENLTTVKVDSAWSLRYRSSADSWAECTLEDAGGIGFEHCRQVRERHVCFTGRGASGAGTISPPRRK